MTDLQQVMKGIADVQVGVEEVKGDVKAINAKLEARPCARHEGEIKEVTNRVDELEKEQIRTGSAKAFWARLIPAVIASIPIWVVLWKMFTGAAETG